MKTNKLFVLLALLSVGLLSACAARKAVYFTQPIRQNVESYDIIVDQIQFYNSHKIVLYRNLSYEQTKVASGKIRFENGEFIERIIIKKNTPGLCETFDDNMIDVSFEQGENRQLKFVRDSQDKYRISALEWKNKEGKINYDTTFFYIAPGGERALLKVKLEDIFKFKTEERVAPGRSISGSK